MKGVVEKFQDAIAALNELYQRDVDAGRHVSETAQQALTFLDKHQNGSFNPSHVAQLRWPTEPKEKSK